MRRSLRRLAAFCGFALLSGLPALACGGSAWETCSDLNKPSICQGYAPTPTPGYPADRSR